MMSLLLTPLELEELTGRKRCKEQSETLTKMHIRWTINAAGSLIVGRLHVEQVLSGMSSENGGDNRKKPNLKALNA